ncbi:MAG: flagellar protein FlaG [Acidobacteria bacterium]|nr:flagellar protein FlaG [Acidobacteriota bacterium]
MQSRFPRRYALYTRTTRLQPALGGGAIDWKGSVFMDINPTRPDAAPVLLVDQPLPAREVAERRELVKAVRAINETSALGQNNELTYAVDRDTRRTVVRIINKQTRELVAQLPSEQVLELARQVNK